jgi:hypothetical protein
MIIESENYKVWYEKNDLTIYFRGALRLWDPTDYARIKQLMMDVYELESPCLYLNFKDLEFLNSSGISTLCKFIFDAKDLKKKPLKIIGSSDVLWQKKSFENLLKIWSELELVFE